ncbi:MAG: hypothetical protein WDA60_12355 [Acidimicrobiia bacterium]
MSVETFFGYLLRHEPTAQLAIHLAAAYTTREQIARRRLTLEAGLR